MYSPSGLLIDGQMFCAQPNTVYIPASEQGRKGLGILIPIFTFSLIPMFPCLSQTATFRADGFFHVAFSGNTALGPGRNNITLSVLTKMFGQPYQGHNLYLYRIPCPPDRSSRAVPPFLGSGMTFQMDLKRSNFTGVLLLKVWSMEQSFLIDGFTPAGLPRPPFHSSMFYGQPDLLNGNFPPRPKALRSQVSRRSNV